VDDDGAELRALAGGWRARRARGARPTHERELVADPRLASIKYPDDQELAELVLTVAGSNPRIITFTASAGTRDAASLELLRVRDSQEHRS
jgi:hypothetical protein